jgi:hypothetical protein
MELHQNSRCCICGGPGPLMMDHDHATDSPRGLLCRQCNVGLGMFKDDVRLLSSAANYVAAWGSEKEDSSYKIPRVRKLSGEDMATRIREALLGEGRYRDKDSLCIAADVSRHPGRKKINELGAAGLVGRDKSGNFVWLGK